MMHKPTTWAEFKKEIERQGIKEDTLLRYIDIDFPVYEDMDETFRITIRQNEEGIEISKR